MGLTSVLLILLFALTGPAFAKQRLRLATTTSTENSGLLAVLLPPFEKAKDCKVDVIAVGTGKAIKLAEAGDVDVVMVHARKKEDAFVAAGFGVNRKDVMYNDFVLVGPTEDPAEVKGSSDVAVALQRIAANGATFVSRGDQSGTHSKELALWQEAAIIPRGDWYLEAGRGMGEVIIMAGERLGYTLTDRGTWLAFSDKSDLQILSAGDKRLFNPYGVIAVNPAQHPHVAHELANTFIDYLVAPQAQDIIARFTRNGEKLFFTY
jgi:tungstate transport system substrate-binding protein